MATLNLLNRVANKNLDNIHEKDRESGFLLLLKLFFINNSILSNQEELAVSYMLAHNCELDYSRGAPRKFITIKLGLFSANYRKLIVSLENKKVLIEGRLSPSVKAISALVDSDNEIILKFPIRIV